jgi:DMSO/TMAO reductase YedYZ molybdopterin-dependent catalytic subunit
LSNLKERYLDAFSKGIVAGLGSLGFLFVLRLGGISPFPPESALEAFIKIIPEKVQEPSIQQLGSFAGQLGLIIATAISAIVYGVFGIVFAKWYAPQMSTRKLSRLEKFLIFSFAPFLFFGLVVLPASGASVFGIASGFADSSSVWLFPLSLFFANSIYGFALAWQYGSTDSFSKKEQPKMQVRESVAASRRTFVEKSVIALGAVVLLATGINGLLTSQGKTSGSSDSPSGSAINSSNAPKIFDDPRLASLVNSEVTANDNFYQVDIDIFTPAVNVSTWSLQVGGLVQNPKTYSLADLQNLPKSTEYNTFECVSNNVNGNLISNAEWGGVKLSDLLSDVGGASSGAQYVVFYSVDGYSVGVPFSKAMMSDSILAYEMNSVPLPQNHGYPLRAVFPGLYGMMSAKWIRKIQVVNAEYMGYWQTRGWSSVGIVQTLAFITVPSNGGQQSLSANNGSAIVGGYAYAGDRGISKVEVSLDGGNTWQEASLKPSISKDTWALWAFEWKPSQTGEISVYARATDGTGAVQSSTQTANFPNGATGYAATLIFIVK